MKRTAASGIFNARRLRQSGKKMYDRTSQCQRDDQRVGGVTLE
jgi:hypothetical protein